MSARPMRFCMLTTFYPPWSFGGDGIFVQRLSQALALRGHSVTVVHSAEAFRTLSKRQVTQPADEAAGITVIPVDAHLGSISPLATYLTGRPLLTRQQLAGALAEGFDVMNYHNPSLLGGPGVLQMGSGVKIYTIHEQWLVCPTHVLLKYNRKVCEKPHCIPCTLSYRRPPQPWRATDLLSRQLAQVDALMAPSRTTISLHARYAPIVRIEHIRPFAPDDSASDAPGIHRDRPYFLYVGRLDPIKGVDTLISAFRRRRSEDLLIVGTGTLERSLRRAAADLPHVHFLGWQSRPQVGGLYRNALALVVPTRGHENFPQVLLEAFTRRLPAIVTRFGALEEVAAESGAALTFGDDDELLAALDRIAARPSLRAELGARGLLAMQRLWSERAFMSSYFGLIAELASQRGDAELASTAAEWARTEEAR